MNINNSKGQECTPRDYDTLKKSYFELLNEYKYVCHECKRLRKLYDNMLSEQYYDYAVRELEERFLHRDR